VILPLNLARSQWDPILPALAERYCTIVLGGAFLGFVQSLEQRIRGGYRGVVRALFEAADIQPGETIAEIGCGSGAVVRWLARWTDGGNPITAVDVNRYLLREAASLTRAAGLDYRIEFQHGDAEALPLAAESVDACLSFTVMEEVDADRMLAEMVRVTRPGGRVGVVVRATDLPPWMNVPLRPELQAMIAASPNAGAAELGCADASLYRRFAAAGLTGLRMGPRLAANQPEPGSDLLSAFTARILQSLPLEAAEEFRSAVNRAVEDETMIWAEAYHSAVGTKPRV
jgi:ubiquinone/menaquinone biosynthesis C-methylase UbiE